MRTLLSMILLVGAIRLPVHRDVSRLPRAIRASLPADFDPAREALAGALPDGGPVTILAPSRPLPTDGGIGTIVVFNQVPICRGEVTGEVVKPSSAGVLYRVPRNIGGVRVRIQTRAVEACPAQPARDTNCVCQGVALSPKQLERGVHICAGCRAP